MTNTKISPKISDIPQVRMIRERLIAMRDEKYAAFSASLMPGIDPDRVIGVRVPVLRRFARELSGTDDARRFLRALEHYYYEENNLHAFLIERIANFDDALAAVETFLSFIDNWATCDSLVPLTFAENVDRLIPPVDRWLASDHTYTVRYAIGTLMRYFLGDRFQPQYADRVAAVKSDEYYVQMMQAWYFATALAKNRDEVWGYLDRLDPTVRKMTIRKAIDSRRISEKDKALLRRTF